MLIKKKSPHIIRLFFGLSKGLSDLTFFSDITLNYRDVVSWLFPSDILDCVQQLNHYNIAVCIGVSLHCFTQAWQLYLIYYKLSVCITLYRSRIHFYWIFMYPDTHFWLRNLTKMCYILLFIYLFKLNINSGIKY